MRDQLLYNESASPKAILRNLNVLVHILSTSDYS